MNQRTQVEDENQRIQVEDEKYVMIETVVAAAVECWLPTMPECPVPCRALI